MPKKQQLRKLRRQLRFSTLPYGYWVTTTGEEIIFSRTYHPLLARQPGQQATPEDRDRWVDGIVERNYFFTDGNFRSVKSKLPQIVNDFTEGRSISKYAMT